MFTHPGKVPAKFTNPETYHQVHTNKTKRKLPFLKPRWCAECDNFKPARAHHCSECGHCVLKMDHHCPWVNNCIGYYNHGHFYRFVISVDVSVLFSMVLVVLRMYLLIKHNDYERSNHPYFKDSYTHAPLKTSFLGFKYSYLYPISTAEIAAMTVNAIILCLLLLLVGGLSVYQTFYISSGATTIETFENEKLESLVRRDYLRREKALFPFDLEPRKNWALVLGPRRWLWFIPCRVEGDGILYEVNDNYSYKKTVIWPPPEYYRYRNDPNWRGEEVEDDEDTEEDLSSIGYDSETYNSSTVADDDEDVPLGLTYRRVRRGSEGYEVSF